MLVHTHMLWLFMGWYRFVPQKQSVVNSTSCNPHRKRKYSKWMCTAFLSVTPVGREHPFWLGVVKNDLSAYNFTHRMNGRLFHSPLSYSIPYLPSRLFSPLTHLPPALGTAGSFNMNKPLALHPHVPTWDVKDSWNLFLHQDG